MSLHLNYFSTKSKSRVYGELNFDEILYRKNSVK